MPTPADRFLDTVVRPFADEPELAVHVRRELEERINPSSVEDPAWQAAAGTLDRRDRWRSSHRWRIALATLATFVLSGALYPGWMDMRNQVDAISSLRTIGEIPRASPNSELIGRLAGNLTSEQKLIAFGDMDRSSPSERWETLHRHFPDNPAYFAEYTLVHLEEYHSLPDGFLETAARIDPENGWFLCLASAVETKSIVTAPPRSNAEKEAHAPKQWKVSDAARFQHALDLFARGTNAPRFESYQYQRVGEILTLLPPPDTMAATVTRMVTVAEVGSGALWQRRNSDLLGARILEAAESGDREEFLRIVRLSKTFLSRQIEPARDLVAVLAAYSSVFRILPEMRHAASRLEMSGHVHSFDEIRRMNEAWRALSKAREDRPEISLVMDHGGIMASLSLPMLMDQSVSLPPIDENRLKPSRLADHAWSGRVKMVVAAAIIAAVAGIVALYRFRHGKILGRLSSRVAGTLPWSGWLWIAGAGVLGPWVWSEAISRLSPLGGRGFNLRHDPAAVGSLFAATVTLAIIAPIVITRWRMAKHLPHLGLHPAKPWLGWIILVVAMAAVPLSGLPYVVAIPGRENWSALFAIRIGALWWTGVALLSIFGRRERALVRQTHARILVPAYLLQIIVVAVVAFTTFFEERHWMALDTLIKLNADTPTLVPYEYEVAMARKAEVREILAPLEKLR